MVCVAGPCGLEACDLKVDSLHPQPQCTILMHVVVAKDRMTLQPNAERGKVGVPSRRCPQQSQNPDGLDCPLNSPIAAPWGGRASPLFYGTLLLTWDRVCVWGGSFFAITLLGGTGGGGALGMCPPWGLSIARVVGSGVFAG